MRQFFIIVFGGLFAIVAGVGIAYGGSFAWKHFRPQLSKLSSYTNLASLALRNESDSASLVDALKSPTSISGTKKTIRYTASEEEDLINAAEQALPSGSDDRIKAKAYLLKNLTRGDVTIDYESDRLLPIASVSKLVTAVIARRLIDSAERITITKEIMSRYGNTAIFNVGETFKASDLYYPLLMVSSNDAAEALAQDYDRKKFIKAMNDWVQSIGAYRTYFEDPSGLSVHNVSTANDLALIMDWIRKNDPDIIKMTLLKSKTVRSHTWVNPTHFLSWSYYIGGKNGFTSEANNTAVSLFTLGKNKNVYVAVLLNTGNRDADMIRLVGKVRE